MSNAAWPSLPSTATSEAHDASCLRATSRGKIVGAHRRLRDALETVDRVARSSCTVLVTGEKGTGKELVAAALHDASTRRDAPFVIFHCAAIPESLVESELFGRAKGVSPSALTSAEGGTLVLDEVAELPLSAQGQVLQLLRERQFTPLGECLPVGCDVRVVATTHRDISAEVKAGRFREDLYERLNVIHIPVPALRNRKTDLPALATHFFRVFAKRYGRDDLEGIWQNTLVAIQAHTWPGNVRALENAIQHAVLLARGPLVEPHDVLDRSEIAEEIDAPSTMSAIGSPATVEGAAASITTPAPAKITSSSNRR